MFFFLLLFPFFLFPIPIPIRTSSCPCAPLPPPSSIPLFSSLHFGLCLHPGSPLFKWPTKTTAFPSCLPQLRSRQISLDPESGIVFAEKAHCFHPRGANEPWTIGVEWRCNDGEEWRKGQIEILFPVLGRSRQLSKRWLHRRNPRNSQIHFKEDKYVVELPENVPIRSVVTQVQAHHDTNQPLFYAFSASEDSRSINLFSLDTESGEIRIARSLDREQQSRHVLKVLAFERLDPSQAATVTVTVDVLDVQDNAPVFERATYYAEIREDAPIGTTVLSVFARDFDDGPSGEVEYSLQDAKDGAGLVRLFSINSKSGVVQTAAQLDHELAPTLLLLQAVATDRGQPPMRSSTNLEIDVLDVNDNAPQFDEQKSGCEAMVAEDVPIPMVVLHARAKDADSGLNGKVHYSIVSQSAPLFSIDYESGAVSLRDRPSPKQSPMSLLIRAKDGGQPALFATLQCTVKIVDVNDHSPAFIGIVPGANQLELFVDENAPIGQEIGRLLAVDGDSGPNGEITYRIEGDNKPIPGMIPFEMDPTNGALRTNGKLDRELQSHYNFVVVAEDGGTPTRNMSLKVKVNVKDINDNSPVFHQSFYHVELDEDTPRGQKLLVLKAQDADEMAIKNLVYRIERQNPPNEPQKSPIFALTNLGPDQGALLSLAREFSPSDDKFLLEISATDPGDLRGHCNVSVTVKDVNRAPTFIAHPFLVRIAENAPIGAPVAKMEATDEDRGQNALLTYAMDSEMFRIDAQSGLITVRGVLDRESQSAYTVDVRVMDAGTPPLESATTLEIVLDDVNDNAPRFLSEQYRASIPEDIPVGTSFLQVQAQDPDEGPNGQIDYLLDADDPFVRMDRFRLDRTSGTLRVNQPLDRENVSKFLLPLVAQDRGSPQTLSSRSVIEVTVEDVNDNAPKFEFSAYDLYVAENAPAGTLVGQITAQDPDQGQNAHIQFRIFGGTDAQLFELDRDPAEPEGIIRIRTRQQFDFEAQQNKFTLELQASSGQLSTTVPVRVHVLDANDHPPQLADPFVVLVAQFVGDEENEEEQMGGQNLTIGQVPAYDPDQNATLEYGIVENGHHSSPILELDPHTGTLSLRHDKWRRQIDTEQRVCVSDGPNTVCATAQINFVPISAELLRTGAVSVILEQIESRDQFLTVPTFRRFVQTMASLWDWTVPENIRVFGVEEQKTNSAEGTKQVMVNFLVIHDVDETVINAWRVEETFAEKRANLSTLFGSRISVKRDQLCATEPCAYYQRCRSNLKFVGTQETISTDDFLFRPLVTSRSFSCECPRGFFTNESAPGECNQRLNLCFDGPCLHGGICHPLEEGFRCECPEGRSGPHCELASRDLDTCLPGFCFSGSQCQLQKPARTALCVGCPWRSVDSDERCRLRAVSLGGDSYLAVAKAPSRMDWSLELSLATISPSGTLLFAGRAEADFFHLYLEGGLPKVRFSLGGNQSWSGALADQKMNRVNDGQWHTLRMDYTEWKLRLSLDNCDSHSSLLLGPLSPHCAVEIHVELPKKCLTDPAVPCHRFLDLPQTMLIGGTGANVAKDLNSDKFVGVVKDLYFDGNLIHFSNWNQLERVGPNVWPGSVQYRPDYCMQNNPCPEQSRCLDQWLGHHCRCALRVHSPRHNCSSLQAGQEPPALTLSDDSFAVWALPQPSSALSLPFSMAMEFRTRERKTQVITLEFEQAAQLLIFSVESGQSMVRVNGGEQYLLPYPPLADGNWHSVEAQFGAEAVEIVVDGLYKKTIPLLALSTPRSLHSGTVPSSSHPAKFIGCIRNVEWNGQRMAVAQQSGTRHGCLAPNACQLAHTVCPANSKCVRDWDRHKCKCHSGYVGDNCVDVCSVPGICGPNSICVHSPNSTRGYECICPGGKVGPNCELTVLVAECPTGWFGQFPSCKRCQCSIEAGFAHKCNGTDGTCICREGTFLAGNNEDELPDYDGARCVPCECGYGTAPGFADRCDWRTGQCQCIGDAVGRQCDRCDQRGSKVPVLLERRSLKCVPIHGRCPSQMASGIQWPTSAVGTAARHSCAAPLMGIAIRGCSEGGLWMPVNDSNCTLFELQNNFENLPLSESARRLANATAGISRRALRAHNLHLAVDLLARLVLAELVRGPSATAESARGARFSRTLFRAGDALLGAAAARGDDQQHQQILNILAIYGSFLATLHAQHPFLRSFQMAGDNFVFSVNDLPSSTSISSSTSKMIITFPDRLQANNSPNSPPAGHFLLEFGPSLSLANNSLWAFSATIRPPNPDPPDSPFSPIFALHISSGSDLSQLDQQIKSATVTLPIVSDSFGHPDCVVAHLGTNLSQILTEKIRWSSAQLVALNGTHLECRLLEPGQTHKFPLLARAVPSQRPAGILFFPFAGSNFGDHRRPFGPVIAADPLPILSTLLALFAFALLALAFGIALCRHCHHCRLLRCTLITVFSLNAFILQMAQRIEIGQNGEFYCALRNAFLAGSLFALFAWLLFYALHLCRMIVESAKKECHKIAFSLGLIIPLLIGICEFALSRQQNDQKALCHIPAGSAPFWLLTVPSAILCLLNFYSLATSWLLSWHKQYQPTVARLSLRRALLAHSILVFLCLLFSVLALFPLFHPSGSHSSDFSTLCAILLAFVAVHLFLWANFFAPSQHNPTVEGNNVNASKSTESMWMMARGDQQPHSELLHAHSPHHHQHPNNNLLMFPDSASASKSSANFYANSPFHRAAIVSSAAKRRPRLMNDGKIYEGIPNEWIPPAAGEADDGLALSCGEQPSYVHHTLQRSLEVDLPRILSPPQRPNAPSSMVVADGNWPMEMEETAHFTCSTLPPFGTSNSTANSPFRRCSQNRPANSSSLRQPPLPHHYGSVRTINGGGGGDSNSEEDGTPKGRKKNGRRRRTQPIQFTGGSESPRSRKFGPANALDDELNSAYFTFTRRREQIGAGGGGGIIQQQNGVAPTGAPTTFTT